MRRAANKKKFSNDEMRSASVWRLPSFVRSYASRSQNTRLVSRVLVALTVYLLCLPVAHAWWDLTWDERTQLIFDNSSQTQNLDNFPVLVVLTPSVVDYSKMEPGGADLRFVDADDATLLDHEIESWSPGGTSYVWVRVPRIDGSSSTDFIYLYYDKTGAPDIQNPSGVWSAGYLAVWHMDDDPSGAASVLDSTGNAKHGTGSAPMNAGNVVAGQIGQATIFDGSTDVVRVPSNATDILAVTGNFITVEAWVTRSGPPAHGAATNVLGRQIGTSFSDSYALFGDNADITRYGLSTSNSFVFVAGAVPTPDPDWYYLATTHDASFTRVYSNGAQLNQSAIGGPITTDNNDVTIGAQENTATSTPSEWHEGRIDEVRISNVARSADWIAAQHLSMTQSFVTFEHEISGTVFEDANFSGTATDYDGGTNDLALANVDVELYSNTDTYIGSTTTDGSGNFSFWVVDGDYKVRARTATIGDSNTPPDGGFNAACGVTDPASGNPCVVAEQTWANGAAAYGGQSATADDTATNNDAGPGDTWSSFTVSGASVPDVNFGFAYNLIANTNNSGQGSLDNFIDNANAIGSANGTTANSSEFRIPGTDPNFAAGVAVISPTAALPPLTDAGTTIDATTQTDNNGNTNAAVFGTGGTVGVDAVSLSTVAGPEVEIRAGVAIDNGFNITANSVTIQGFAILGFGSSDDHGAIRLASTASGATIQNNVLGTTAASFTDPGVALRNWSGVTSIGADNGTITNNLIGFSEERGIWMDPGSTIWTISNNEIRDIGMGSVDGDGTSVLAGCDSLSYTGNLFTGSSSQAAAIRGSTNLTFTNNTFTGNGVGDAALGVAQSAGITVRPGAISALFDRNIFSANYGAGLQINETATGPGTRLTRNSFVDNGTILARDLSLPTGQIGIDLNHVPPPLPAEDPDFGTAPFYTPNDTGDADAGGNTSINFPILDTASISGGNLTLTGWALPGATIELFITDGDPSGFGEGETYVDTFAEGSAVVPIDTDPAVTLYSSPINGLNQGTNTTNRFSFTIPTPAGVVDGTELTATGTVGNNTSEFSGRVIVAAVAEISGTVFEDIIGDALNDGAINSASNPGAGGVTVNLYLDSGDGIPNAADGVPVATTTTDATPGPTLGTYSFGSLAAGTYFVAVDSVTLAPQGGYYFPSWSTGVWSEQTYGPTDGYCADGLGGTAIRGSAGVCYGGRRGNISDATTDVGTAEHVARAVVAGSVTEVDFGFSFNVFVNNSFATEGHSNVLRSDQGSLDQALRNTSVIPGADALRFVPAIPTNATGGGGNWWSIDYDNFGADEFPHQIADNDTTLDGTAFDLADGITPRNTNPGFIGANASGTVTVGTTSFALPQVEKPELEIIGKLVVRAFGTAREPENAIIRDLAVWGNVANAVIDISHDDNAAPNILIENIVVGSRPDTFADPGATSSRLVWGSGIAADNGTIRNSLLGFAGSVAMLDVDTGWVIEGNEITGPRVAVSSAVGGTTIRNNLINVVTTNNSNFAADTWDNNTISATSGNGLNLGSDSHTVRNNVFENNVGVGISVSTTSQLDLITENAFLNNGSIAIDNQSIGPVVTINDGALDGSSGNSGLDFPVIDSAVLDGGNLTVTGFARAGVTIEFYEAVGAANDNNTSGDPHGEGVTYLFTSIEGVSDADTTTGASYTDPGYGTDPNVNRFSFTVAAPAGLVIGEEISPIAYFATSGTSEFGPNFTVTPPGVTLDGVVFEDANFAGTASDYDGGVNDLPLGDADVELYTNADVYISSTTTDGSGSFSFAGLVDGTYKVRVRTATIGDNNTAPSGGFNAACGITDPTSGVACAVAEQTWGNGAVAYGGQSAIADDTATNNDAGPGDTWVSVAVSGSDVTDVNFGFAYNLIVNTNNAGQGSLSQFISNANEIGSANGTTANSSEFRVPVTDPNFVAGVATITPNPALPIVTDPIILDASTQPGYAGSPIIEIDGSSAADNLSGFHISAGGSTVRGFVIHGFKGTVNLGSGIHLDTVGGNTITANWLGTDATGAAAGAAAANNNTQGLFIDNIAGNQVGGTNPADRNVMSGNRLRGMLLEGTGASGNTIEGNYVGTNASGTAAVANPMGIYFDEAPDNTVGGTANGAGNVISGNGIYGLYLVYQNTARNIVKGNTIGLNEDRSGPIGNGGAGISTFEADDTEIGGTENGAGNVISANDTGIALHSGSIGTLIQRNSIYDNTGLGIDLGFNSAVDPNDGAVGAGANNGMDYPVFTSAVLGPGTLSVTGYVGSAPGQAAFANAVLEVFLVDNAPADQNGEVVLGDGLSVPHGEGRTYLGTVTADASGNFSDTLAVVVSAGDEIVGTAYLAANGSSEFGSNFTVTGPATIAGTIFVDTVGDGLADGPIGVGPNLWEAGARIELYRAGPDGDADGGDDTYIGFTTSSAVDGSYSFTGLSPDTYYITVDSQGVDDGPYNPGYSGLDAWPEQTYGPVGAASFDGATWTYAASAGSFYGGARWDVSDNHVPTNSLPTGDHIARVDTAGGDVNNVDFGFSFNVVTTTRGGSAAQDPGAGAGRRTVQGSFRQFLTNANAHNSNDVMRFVPAAPPTVDLDATPGNGDEWWRIDVSAALPDVADSQTTIDGTAYELANGTVVRDALTGTLGSGATVGASGAVTLPLLEKPELQIVGAIGFNGITISSSNSTLRRVALRQFAADVLVNGGNSGVVIEDALFGSNPDALLDPGVANRSQLHVQVTGSLGGVVRRTIGAYSNTFGYSFNGGATGWTADQNEIIDQALNFVAGDGMVINGNAVVALTNNLVERIGGFGISIVTSGASTVSGNTIRTAGTGLTELAGIAVQGDGSTISDNLVTLAPGPGIAVGVGADQVTLSANHYGSNGGLAIELVRLGGGVPELRIGDGINLNDGATVAGAGNQDLDYPIIDGASLSGGNLTVTGYARAGVTIEFYEAVGAADDNNLSGNPHGEGVTYLFTSIEGIADADATTGASYTDPGYGADASVDRFSFTVAAPAGLVVGDELSSIADLAGNGTSEFGPNFTVTGPVVAISGSVFEDAAGNVLDGGEAIGDANNPTVNGVDVRLYNDDGATANQPDGTDTLRAGPVATAGAGAYSFAGIPDGTYWVVVDSRTVSPAAGIHPSYLGTTPWAEQTFGPDNGWCADGAGGTAERVGAGPCYGGVDGATDDDITALTSSEHIARVVISGGAVSNVDFGFSYNVVSNVEPAGNASFTASTFQGSIDQFVRNANSINGINAMRFVPAVPTNATAGGGTWWRVDYTTSIVGETVTDVHDAGTSINGTAYDLADGTTIRNTNPGNLGANAAGGLTVGVTLVPLPQVAKPELELMRSDSGIGDGVHFDSNLATGQVPNQFAVRDMSIWGFGTGIAMTGVPAAPVTGITLERNVIGSRPDAFVDPGGPNALIGVRTASATNTSIVNNLIGFLDNEGVQTSAVTTTAVSGNEIRETGQVNTAADGINYGAGSASGTITGNLIVDSGGMGIDGTSTGNLVADNTITGSGQRGVQTAGIRQTGSNNLVRGNIASGNVGPGLIVPDTVNDITAMQNHFSGNGSIAIDLVAAGGATATGDGIMLNDGATDVNDGNDGLDYPIIDGAALSGGNLTVTGYARAGVTIEFYEAVGAADDNNLSGNSHGEGVTYLFTSIEGIADADATTGASYTDPGYGADGSVDRFSFTVAAPAGLVVGDELSSIADLAGNGTSEFGPNFTVTGPVVAISGSVFEDTAGNVLDGGESIGDAGNPTVNGVDVWLYNDDGATANQPDGTDTLRAGPVATAGAGAFSFSGVPDGTYWVVVDSQDLGTAPAWAEQTYGPIGGWCADGAGGTAENVSAGACYGGRRATASDDLATWNSDAEHIARVVVSGGAASNVDFGFSFNAVTTTRGGSAAADPGATGAQTVQGSLRQFIQNANAIAGANAMRFVPAEPTNATLAGNNWWRVSITSALPDMIDAGTSVDGAAYSRVDGVSPLNTNTAAIGSGAAVGVLGVFITPLLDPELEIQGDGVVTAAFNALTTADNTEIRNTAINSFATMAVNATGLLPDPLDSLVVENNVVGTSPASFTDNPALYTGAGIVARDLSNSTIRNNLIGWVGRGFQISFNSADTLIETNEIRGVDTWSIYLNGVASTSQQAERITLQGNLIESSPYIGTTFETQQALSDLTINQNTIRFNSGLAVRVYGANNTVTGNVISDNSGDGLVLVGVSGGVPAAASNLVSQNQFGNNGGQAIDLTETGTNGDNITINDDGDPDLGANELLNYPIIESAQILGPNLVVSGFALPGTNVEFYIADADPSGFGEGVTYLFSAVEGSGADTDGTSGTYGPGAINGLLQGTDTTNRFTFSVPTPGGVGLGTDLTATGTIANATSEFSGRATVSNNADLVMTKVLDASTPGPFAEGDAVTYLLTVTNNGPAQATNVTATDTYPGELTLGVPVPSAPTTYVAGTGVWTIGTLNSGASATLSLPGTVNAGTAGDVVTNSVTAATADQVDPTTVGDDLAETFTVLPFLSIDDVAQAETDAGTTTFTFTVSINQAVGYDVTFDVDTADGTATIADSDYVAISGGSGTILAGATTTTVDVTVNGDNGIEPSETFFVDLSNVLGVAVTDNQGQGTINNDDGATVSVAATTDANEAGPVNGQFTVTQSTTSASDTAVTYTVAGTATPGGTDYATLSGTVTVLAGATTATIDVTGIVADALVEGSETVIVTLTGTDNPGIVVAVTPNDTATVNILDNNTADVSIASTVDANESGPVDGQFTVTQSATSASDTVVTYTVAGTATAGGTDYTTLSGTVTILAGATTATIDVTGIVVDALVEGTETVIVTLTATDNPGITVAASPADTATVSIIDADTANVSIAATTDANEAGPVDGQFTVTQSVSSVSDTVVTYTVAGTATAGGTDYATLSGSVTVLAGDTTATIDVTGIVADALIEGSETVIVTLTATDNPGITVAASPADTATLNILDNGAATVGISAIADANEAGPVDGQFMVTQSTSSITDTVISYTVAGTATPGGTDYATLSGSVTILAGDTAATIDVTGIVADALVEGSETVIVTLTGTDNVSITVAPNPNDTATVNILDNAGATVSVASTVDANEAGPVDGQFTVTQSTTSASDTVVSYTVAGTATAGGTDYATLSGTVTVLAGATTATIDVTGINADALIEGTETVIVTLTATDNVGIAVAASPNDTATVNILDNNAATVSVAATTDGNEAGPVDGQFTITQSATSVADTVISYSVAGTAAAGGTDYASLSGSVTVLAGATTATINVTGIVDDTFVEGSETVIVTLTGTDNVAITVAASPNDAATINILDNDGATVSIAPTTNGAESGPVDGVFTVTQSAASVNDTVLSYTVAGTATSASDYTALSGTVTILGGATTALINVPVIDDVVAEGIDETVVITLSSITASDPGISIAASPADTASLTIADNDADLITTKAVSNAMPVEGASITYTISVNNSAGVQATNVSLTDLLPAGVSYVSDDSGGTYNSTSGLWSIGTINAATVATLNIMATVDAGASALAQPIANTTTAAIGDQADPDTSTDVLTANITVDANADLVTTKIVDNVSPVENATIVYTISVFNNGAAQATNVYLTDLLPTGISYVGDDTGGAYNPVTGVWTIGTIDNGAIATLNITATVDTGAGALAQPITNITTAAIGDQPDPDATTDDLTEDITVNYTADIVTTKSVDVATPVAGDTVVYTLTATNNGPGPASNVSLTDLLPAGVTYLSDDGAGTYNSATGVWTIGSLANTAIATLNISATVDAGAGLLPQPITNTTSAAIGDQADGDVTGDDLVADIIVNLIDPNLIQLTKTAGRDRANVGEIVSYSIEIRNSVGNPIGAVRISDSPSRGFKYVPGTAQLNGVPVADPTIGLPLQFDIGTLPGFVDGNGNGVADSGEPGYAVLSYRMVAGSGVAPGIWTNTAIATANCDTCFVSNIASADIEIIEDTLFDLGTIIGKVFYDGDNDGWQDSGEAGIEAAMVALDDGTYALTDEFGRYHFPAVKPGQRLLKINLNSLAGQAKATNGKTRIVSVTPGLMAKANFGVILDTVDKAIGEDGQFGIGVDSETTHPPLLINGSTLMPSLLVNGEPVSLASADVKLGKQKIRDVVELANGKLVTPIRFSTKVDADTPVKRWKLIVKGARDEIARTWKGKGTPPEFIEWDGVRKNGKLINSGGIYTYHLEMTTGDGQKVSSSYRLFGVNRLNSISLNLAGGAFISASHELTGKAKDLLSETAKAIRAYPDEIVVISGHTDSVGSNESNMALAERRARSAYDYLRKEEGLPEEQFVVQAFGETRPIAGNDTVWGRELNRRVEISGDLDSVDRAANYDPYRQPPVVRINANDIEVDESGAFRTKIDLESGQETMNVLLSTSQGRSVETVVKLPTLHVISPQGRVAIPIDRDRAGSTGFDANDVLLQTELLARTEPENTVEFNGEPVDIDENGLFMAPLPVRSGENYYGLVARNPMGMLRIANLRITLDDASVNEPEFVVEPVPQLALQLPPPGIPMTNSNLVVPGSTVPGNRVYINDNEVKVDADGSFTATVELKLGENLFTARVVDQDGHAGQIEQVFDYNGDPMFYMALVDGTVSKLQTTGSLQAAGNVKRDETVSRGRIAYYLKGHVLGKYLLTSAFDSGDQELGEIFSDLTAQDNDRLLTNLDPDTLYPVYGDNSTVVYDAQSQSKFYLALESETVTALIGNYALNFTDTELAGYQRTLYGASATYQSEAKDESGNSRTKAQAFYANIAQAHVRDELRATGGSLYYLSQRGVIEGSEHISVIVRDQDSGLILRRTALQQGLDYSIDYVDGRLLTNRPVSSFSADNSLVESDLLGGSAVYLQIDYETVLDGFEQTAMGGRVRQGIGERLAVGVTSVDEDQLGGEYSLKAADAEFKLGKNSRLIAEFATSEGNNSAVNVSDDGGLTYQTVTPVAGSSGEAFKIAAEIDAGEWFGYEDRLLMNTYYKRLDTGFSANSVTSEQGSEKSGFAASWEISDSNSLLGRFERQTQLAGGNENTLATLQWNFVRKLWGVAAEIEDRGGYAGDATIAAVRMTNRWTDTLSTTLQHQQTLSGLENDQSTVGVAYRATDRLTLDASATQGTQGASAQLGAQFDWRGNKLYAAQQFNDLEVGGTSNNRLVGVEAPFGQDGAVYSEYHWSRLPVGRQRQAMFGARQRFQATDGLRIEISGEHSAENATTVNTGERYALSIGATFDNDGGITFSTRNEYRKDSRSIDSEQFLSTNNLKLALGDDLSVLGKYRFSKSDSSVQLNRNIDFTEASVGLAYRPVEHDRLNLLTRFTRLTNTPTEFQQSSSIAGLTSDIFAVDWSYQVSQHIEWVGKQAMRWSESEEDPLQLRSRTSLSIQRLNWSMPKDLSFGTEYRLMNQDIADDLRKGFVTELMWEGLDPIVLGLGYNFSDVSDNEYVDYDFSTKGPFFRLQGKF